MNKSIKLILCILLPLLVGGVSGFFTSQSIPNWYVYLNKPSFNPPNYLFGPVWTLLYILMGISFYLVINKPNISWLLVGIFITQIILNFFWSFIFFNAHNLGLALFEIVLLWASILAMIILFYKTNKWAAILNIPYLLWVSFATLLNYSIYSLN
jgi:tryptophan-rich sensory protein